MERLRLTDEVMASLRCARVFKESKSEINSVDFSNDGKWLVCGSDDHALFLFDVETGQYYMVMQTLAFYDFLGRQKLFIIKNMALTM